MENSTFYSINKISVHILYCLYINFRRIAEFTVVFLVHLSFFSVNFYGFLLFTLFKFIPTITCGFLWLFRMLPSFFHRFK